jgi:Ca2+-binding RTX toxin-like protein
MLTQGQRWKKAFESLLNDHHGGCAMAVKLNVLGGNGNDTLRNTGAVEVISGGAGIDKLVFDEGTRGISVNLAKGTITDSFGKKDTVSGVEIIIGTSFNDKIVGSDNTDILVGGAGSDSLYGGAGSDELYGGTGNDFLSGGTGSDYFVGGQGSDTISGGSGFDMVDYSDEGGKSGITVDLAANTAIDSYGDKDTFSSIERIRGTDFADKLAGNNSDNMFEGGGGDDVIDGLGGNDVLLGGFGNDIISGGSGADMLTGGRGNDTLDGGSGSSDTVDYSLDAGWHGVSVNLTTGNGEDSWGDLDTFVSIENVIGTSFDDWIFGSKGANVITGGAGNDTLTGAGGNDTFVFGTGHGNDRINDFNAGDKLDVSALGFKTVQDILAIAEGNDLGVLLHTGANSSIQLVDVNISSLVSLGYIFA